jgi:hypothetical protein
VIRRWGPASIGYLLDAKLATVDRALTLLIDGRDQDALKRVQVQADRVADLVDDLRIGRQLPGLHGVRLEAELRPDPQARKLRQVGGGRPTSTVRCAYRICGDSEGSVQLKAPLLEERYHLPAGRSRRLLH